MIGRGLQRNAGRDFAAGRHPGGDDWHDHEVAFVGSEIREYILREMDRVDDRKDDRRIMVFAARR